jgi:hypothetical protein
MNKNVSIIIITILIIIVTLLAIVVNNENLEIEKTNESAVDLILRDLPQNAGKIHFIEGVVEYAQELEMYDYLTVKFKVDSIEELNDKAWRPATSMALLHMVNDNHNWKCGDSFSAYVKVLPPSEYYLVLYPVDGYMSKIGFVAKFNGDLYMSEDDSTMSHFEEVRMISMNSENPKCVRGPFDVDW